MLTYMPFSKRTGTLQPRHTSVTWSPNHLVIFFFSTVRERACTHTPSRAISLFLSAGLWTRGLPEIALSLSLSLSLSLVLWEDSSTACARMCPGSWALCHVKLQARYGSGPKSRPTPANPQRTSRFRLLARPPPSRRHALQSTLIALSWRLLSEQCL